MPIQRVVGAKQDANEKEDSKNKGGGKEMFRWRDGYLTETRAQMHPWGKRTAGLLERKKRLVGVRFIKQQIRPKIMVDNKRKKN